MTFDVHQDGAGRPTALPAVMNVKRGRRGVGAVLFWHAIGAGLAAVVTLLITIAVAQSPSGLNNPDDFLPGWILPALFAIAAVLALTASLVIASLVMGLVAPKVTSVDLAGHGLLVSLGSLFVGTPALYLGLRLLGFLLGG